MEKTKMKYMEDVKNKQTEKTTVDEVCGLETELASRPSDVSFTRLHTAPAGFCGSHQTCLPVWQRKDL